MWVSMHKVKIRVWCLTLLLLGAVLIGTSLPVVILGEHILDIIPRLREDPDSVWFVTKMKISLIAKLSFLAHIKWMAGIGCIALACFIRIKNIIK